jgi:hypothetical protein
VGLHSLYNRAATHLINITQCLQPQPECITEQL